MTNANPYLRSKRAGVSDQPEHVEEPAAPIQSVPTTGPTRPQAQSFVSAPDQVDQLPLQVPKRPAVLWVVGAHGGSGESTIAGLDDLWDEGGHAWPAGPAHEPRAVVITARSNEYGLIRAQAAARQWAAGLVPGVTLLGLVVIADAPEPLFGRRLPRSLRELRQLVAGAYPRTWDLPWIESWRQGGKMSPEDTPRELRKLREDLYALLHQNHQSLGAAGTWNR